jgi:hypothetical protein
LPKIVIKPRANAERIIGIAVLIPALCSQSYKMLTRINRIMLNLDHLRFLPANYRSMLPNYETYVDSVCLTISIPLSAFLLTYGVRSLIFVLLSKDGLRRIIQARRECEIPIPRRHDQFISILVASYNEHKVIERLLESCVALTYNAKRFEIMVIDALRMELSLYSAA